MNTYKRKTKDTKRNAPIRSNTKEAKKPYVMRSTIWNSVGGGLSNPNESKVYKVGKYKVLLTRSERLDKYGNPVHTATVINKDGSLGQSVRSNGSATLIVSEALKKSGVETKHSTPQNRATGKSRSKKRGK